MGPLNVMLIDTQIYKISFPDFPLSWIFFTLLLSGTPFPVLVREVGMSQSFTFPPHMLLCSSKGLGLLPGHSNSEEREQK